MAILNRAIQVADELKLENIVVVFDQAIYAKAQVIRWHNQTFNKRLVLRLGEFHTSMAYMSVLGKRFQECGIQDVLVSSGVVAEGSVHGVLFGTFYNRSIRCYKLLAEAFSRLQWKEFLDSLQLEECLQSLDIGKRLNESFPHAFKDVANEEASRQLFTKFEQHRLRRAEGNPNYALWDSLIEMVETLQLFIRATREGLFALHLASVRSMLPWFFAYDKQNYSRFLTIYWFEMMQLQHTHPQVYAALKDGEYGVQRHAKHPFAQVACDQVIEQTVNRDSKTVGGLIGITRSKAAVHRWLLARLPRAEIAAGCFAMASRENSDPGQGHKELFESRIEVDETSVSRLCDAITLMVNPFSSELAELINIHSGNSLFFLLYINCLLKLSRLKTRADSCNEFFT